MKRCRPHGWVQSDRVERMRQREGESPRSFSARFPFFGLSLILLFSQENGLHLGSLPVLGEWGLVEWSGDDFDQSFFCEIGEEFEEIVVADGRIDVVGVEDGAFEFLDPLGVL